MTCMPGAWPAGIVDPDYTSLAASYGRFIQATVAYFAAWFHLHYLDSSDSYYSTLKLVVSEAKKNHTDALNLFTKTAGSWLSDNTVKQMLVMVQGEDGCPSTSLCDCGLRAQVGKLCVAGDNREQCSDLRPAPYGLENMAGTMFDCGVGGGVGDFTPCKPNTLGSQIMFIRYQAQVYAAYFEFGFTWVSDYPNLEKKASNITLLNLGFAAQQTFDRLMVDVIEDFTLTDLKAFTDEAKFIQQPPEMVGSKIIKNGLDVSADVDEEVSYESTYSSDWSLSLSIEASIAVKAKASEGFQLFFSINEEVDLSFTVTVSGSIGGSSSQTTAEDYTFPCPAPPHSDILCTWIIYRGSASVRISYNLTLGQAWWFHSGSWSGVATSDVTADYCYLNQSSGGACNDDASSRAELSKLFLAPSRSA